jgi:PAS domain S-box-containing protein
MSDGLYVEINEGFTAITGYTRQEVIGHTSAEIMIWAEPADRERLVRALEECGEITDLEAEFRIKNGSLRTGLMSARQIDLDGEAHILSITRDITGRKQAERALRDSEARFRAIFESVAVGIALVDTHTDSPVQTNAIVQEMLGYSRAELERMSFADFTHPDDLKLEWPLYQEMIAGKRNHYQIEKRYIKKDGHILWVRLNVSPVQVSGDQNLLVGIIEDISQRKAAEESLRHQMETNLKQKQELESVLKVSAAMRRADTRAEMVELIVKQSVEVMGAQTGALALVNGTSLVIQAAVGQAADWCGMTISQDQSLFWQVIQNGLPKFIVAELVENGQDFLSPLADASSEITAGIFTPLKSGENTIGLFFVGYNQLKGFTETQVRLALAISDMAGNALQRMSIADALEKMVADRTRELETIYKVTVVASKETGLNIALQNALNPILESLESQIGAILILDEKSQELYLFAEKGLPSEMKARIERRDLNNSLEHWVLAHKQLLVLNDLASDPRMSFSKAPEIYIPFAALPMVVGEKIVGILEIGRLGGKQFDLDELTLLSFVASHLGLVVENVTLLRQAELHAILEERSRMARELHDSVTQLLYSAALYAEGSSRLVDAGDLAGAKGKLGELSLITQQALREMRLMVYELRTPVLHSKGLVRTIQQRLESVELRSGIQATLEHEPLPVLPERVEDALYRITLEALNNSLKHSLAKNVAVSLRRDRNKICLRVQDDGRGFILEEALESGGIGLTSMRERAERLKGNLRIQSAPGLGTEIVAAIPVKEKNIPKSLMGGKSR